MKSRMLARKRNRRNGVDSAVVRESDFPMLYLCPVCDATIHFADGFVFCTACGFARHEDTIHLIRNFPILPVPSTKHQNPCPTYYCEACGGKIVDKFHGHPKAIRAYVREYRFNGGTHATFRIYPFRHLDVK